MRATFFIIICLAQVLAYTFANNGKYTVIAPGTIHSNGKYTASVTVHNISQACEIKISISGPSYNEAKYVEVHQNEIKQVEFDLPSLEKGDYILSSEGVNCLENFKNSTKLLYSKFINRVEILTDKELYKPGDYINYWVLFFGKDMTPVEPEKDAVIWFEDGERNKIKEIKNFKTIQGVYKGKFKISEFPIAGLWSLSVKNGDYYIEEIHFDVYEYAVPKYKVEIDVKGNIASKDDLPVIIRANYNNYKPLVGHVTVVLSLVAYETKPLTKIFYFVNGVVEFTFSLKEFGASLHIGYENLNMEITVKEYFTGIKFVDNRLILVYPFRYYIYCWDENCFEFEANKEMNVEFKVRNLEGSIPQETGLTAELIYIEEMYQIVEDPKLIPVKTENRSFTFKGIMNASGRIHFKVLLPHLPENRGYEYYYKWKLILNDETEEGTVSQRIILNYVPEEISAPQTKVESPKEYFILEKDQSDLNMYVNTPKQFTLNSSQPLSNINYNVIARGNILKSGHVDLPNKPKLYNLTLTADFSWLANVEIYVYFIDEKGGYNFLEWVQRIVLQKETEVSVAAPTNVKPGEEVAFSIKATPNSFVALMALDWKAFIRKSHFHFLSTALYYKHLPAYNTRTPRQGGHGKYPGMFSGCVSLTNAHYVYNNNNQNRQYNLRSKRMVTTPNFEQTPEREYGATWIFADIENTESSEFTWSTKVPDTVTSWYVTAFSMNPSHGFHVTTNSTKITAFQPFDVTINLPYSVQIGEIINVPALVLNYLDEPIDVEVALHNADNEYEFVGPSAEALREQKQTKNIHVLAKSAADVLFLLKPKIEGNIMLKFTSTSSVFHDVIHKPLRVVPEGIPNYANHVYFITLRNETVLKSVFGQELSSGLVPDTEHIEEIVMGDILGPVLLNLDNLLRLPSGCAEQTLSTLMINYLIMKHLKATNRLTNIKETELQHNLEDGIQNMWHYRLEDGSFSSFDSLRSGSTFLTAYAMHSLLQVRELVYVNDKVIEEGFEYLASHQAENGTFIENFDYFPTTQSFYVTVTAAAISAILENPTYADKYSTELHKGLQFIAESIENKASLSAQVMGTYVLNKAKHSTAREKLLKLKTLAKTESDRMYWDSGSGHDVKITAIALLTLLKQESAKVEDVIPIIKWLLAQRNSNGGFASAVDTVYGLMALIKFAQLAAYPPAEMSVFIESMQKSEMFSLTKDNELLHQTVNITNTTKSIEIKTNRTGLALVQISYQNNTLENESNSSFTIKTTRTDNKSRPSHMEMLICVNYVGEGVSSNMAFLEISTPSGYVFYDEILEEINNLKRVGNTELRNSGSLLVVYFDRLFKNEETCLTIEAWRTHFVAMQKAAAIMLYDYYDRSKKATAFYEIRSELCDIGLTEKECSR